MPTADPARARLEAAVASHRAGQLKKAARLYREALRHDPHNPDLLHLLGVVTHQIGNSDRAAHYIEKAIALRPDAADFHGNLGNVLRSQGRREEAIAHYRQALALRPGIAEVHSNLAGALHDLGRLDEAIAQYREALALAPDQAGIHNNLALALKDRGRPDEAVAELTAALALRPDHVQARVALGNLLQEMGRLGEAAACFEAAIAQDRAQAPGQNRGQDSSQDSLGAEALAGLGLLHVHRGETGIALAHLERALTQNPDLEAARRAFLSLLRYSPAPEFRPRLAALLQAFFSRADVDPCDLAHESANQLRLKHEIGAGPAAADAFDGRQWARRIAADGLFLAYLEKTVNVDPALEVLLTRLRRALLATCAGAQRIPGDLERTLCALARQCINNEYVFPVTDDESHTIEGLRREVEDAVPRDGVHPAALYWKLLLIALYEPLHGLGCAAALAETPAKSYPPPLQALILATLHERLEEERIAPAIPSIRAIADPTSRAVMAQYEENPYPRWLSAPHAVAKPYAQILRQDFPHFAPPECLEGPVHVLVAGCGTGRHPIDAALSYAGAEVVAVDLSRRSLAYGMRMAQRLSVDNITFLQGDILDLTRLDRRFHVVECIGVLHHMEDPAKGWSALTECLLPGGILEIGLYSALARQNIVRARARIRTLGLAPTTENIRRFRQRVLSGAEGDALAGLARSEDFFSTSGCRDLLFNVKEHRFTLAAIEDLLKGADLTFIGFVLPDAALAAEYRRRFPRDPNMTDLSHWREIEADFPAVFSQMYQFLCQKKAA